MFDPSSLIRRRSSVVQSKSKISQKPRRNRFALTRQKSCDIVRLLSQFHDVPVSRLLHRFFLLLVLFSYALHLPAALAHPSSL